jgi:hypothetical protein
MSMFFRDCLRFFVMIIAILSIRQTILAENETSANDVWLYLPLDGTLDPAVPSKKLKDVRLKSNKSDKPEFVDGVIGKSLRVTRENHTEFSFLHGRKDFPYKRGSVVLWFRPANELDSDTASSIAWLVDARWACFDLHIEAKRLFFYATVNSQHFLDPDLGKEKRGWAGHWHCAVGTWDGAKVRLYLDGDLLASRDDAAPFDDVWEIRLGSLCAKGYSPGYYDGSAENAPREITHFLNGDLDEFAILSSPLTDKEVSKLYRNKSKNIIKILKEQKR